MANYAIGDVQGCFDDLKALLKHINYQETDTLWFVGDLVNRGPDSLATLRFIKSLKTPPHIVLGNHDLHCLAVAYEAVPLKPKDTIKEILDAPDCIELCDWLRQQPLLHHDPKLGFTMTHTGIPPQWDLLMAQAHAHEVETALSGPNYKGFLKHMYGNTPLTWHDNLEGWERLRLITNYFTRMRFCKPDGTLELSCKSTLGFQPKGYYPWFELLDSKHESLNIIFGHWAALEGDVDIDGIFALDTGCVWGGALTALRLEDLEYFQVLCD